MQLTHHINKKWKKVKDFFYLYTSGMNRKQIEQLLKKDTIEAFSYFKGKTSIDDQIPERRSLKSIIFVFKEIFISFIMQLTPARRFFYGIGIVCFIIGWIQVDWFYIIGAFVIMNFLLALELANKLTTRDELEIAREIQLSLQPFKIPESQILSIATFSKPAKVVGGDFFDIVQPHNKRIVSILGDVSEKGISAALYAAYAQSMFQSLSETIISPSDIMHSLNDLISKRLRDGDFITAVIALFDLNEKSVTIARAGHNWPLYYCSGTQTITELKPKGISIGSFDLAPLSGQLEEQKIHLNHGDLLLLYSDGITEATNPQNHMFDLSGLKSAIKESINESSETIIGRINSRLQQFVKADELQDDATMVAFKIK